MPERLPLRHSPRRYSALLAMSPEPNYLDFKSNDDYYVFNNVFTFLAEYYYNNAQ